MLLYEWFSFFLQVLRLGVLVCDVFAVVGSFFLFLVLSLCHSLEVVVVLKVRELQSV